MKVKKVLVLGASGMLGHKVSLFLSGIEEFQVYNLVYRKKLLNTDIVCDVNRVERLISIVNQVSPDIIINCIGALIHQSENKPAEAIWLNAYFPHLLENISTKNNIKLVHVSTDCVFSGAKGNYGENDFKDADDIYGRSKSLGEIYSNNHCTLRTSIIGPELKIDGSGLLHWLLSQSGTIKGFTNAIWAGVTTLELSKAILEAINNDLKGLFHVTNGEKISKYLLLEKLITRLNLPAINVEPYEDFRTDKSLRTSDKFDFNVPSYDQMIDEMVLDIRKRRDIYEHYPVQQ